ncbi:MAG TPA: peroxiredoxin-like family protein, partial [candidate division Zixibacteria bacterium]|nr:peroxiredoxin-like family protein [candidate division Zixibacteria bacterium]
MATTLKEAIAAMQAELLPQIPEDVVNQLIGAVGDMVASGMDKRARTVGDKIPSFTLSDANGQKRTLAEFLADGPVVLSFYRGAWCPYCNVELHALQDALPQIKEAGAQLVAISPNTPDHSLSSVEKHNLAFPVLSDIGNTVARELGLVFSL